MPTLGSILRQAFLALMLIAWWSGLAPAAAESRIALLIGNGAYSKVGGLPNPPNDMALMAETLGSLDFEVISAVNQDLQGMTGAIQRFGRRLEEAGPDTVALFFYAGHGLQTGGVNFLVPIDAEIQRETDIPVETINLNWVMDQMAFAGTRMNLVIIDACRNNPIVRSMRSGVRGLAQVDAPRGTLIAYATAPGAVAVDGAGANSPYSAALARNLTIPGRSVEEVFRETRVEVLDATDGEQVPWESSSLTGAFYFKAAEATVANVAGAALADKSESAETAEPALDVATLAAPDQGHFDLAFWDGIKDADDPDLFDDYLTRFPDGAFRKIAITKRDSLRREAITRDSPDVAELQPLDTELYVQKRANIRAEPSSNAAILATLDPGAPLMVTGSMGDGEWYRVRLEGGQEAFVWRPLLGEAAPEIEVAAIPDQVVEAATSQPLDRSLTGQWSGHYRCQQDIVGVTIDLIERPGFELEGVFSFYALPGQPSVPEGSFSVTGHVSPENKQITLKSGGWIDRAWGQPLHDLRGELDSANSEIYGRVLSTGCTEIALERRG